MNKRIALICLSGFILSTIACSSGKLPEVRITNGKLLPCPASPNCVSSQAEDKKHKVAPIPIPADKTNDIRTVIVNVLSSMKRVVIVKNTESHIHAVFSTSIFRFKDDVDFLIDRKEGFIHIRSASRIGHSDFGVNRKRIEKLRKIINHHYQPSGISR
ncbi:DUF1499 domain-containing protein [Desulfobacterales bacterium HSG16]|nr:DUF1499 domain-containing protein [Desulfobacterales bacterium HSG16]